MRINKLFCTLILCISFNKICNSISANTHRHAAKNKVQQKSTPKISYAQKRIETHVVVDYTSGNHKILQNNGKDKIIYPASLTKMMTVYILLEKISDGTYKMSDKFVVSHNAAQQEASKTPAKKNETVTVEDTIKAIMAWSANDMAVVVAENVAGSVANFCKLMNAKAKELNMHNTNFCNPSGLHNPKHVSTAHDMAKLAIALSEQFRKYKYLLSVDSYKYKNTTYKTRCKITKMIDGVHCAKTGFTHESWFNLATTATRYNKKNEIKKVCVVVIGRSTSDKRYKDTISYMNNVFKNEYTYVRPRQDNNIQNEIDKIISEIALNKISNISQKRKNTSSNKINPSQNIHIHSEQSIPTKDKNNSGIIYIDEVLYIIDKEDICIGNEEDEYNNVIIEM